MEDVLAFLQEGLKECHVLAGAHLGAEGVGPCQHLGKHFLLGNGNPHVIIVLGIPHRQMEAHLLDISLR